MDAQDVVGTQPQSTRRAVIHALRASGCATVGQLAEMVGIKPAAIRHHLNSLHAEGLVEVEEQRQAVGRPIHIYRLTDKAEDFFPHSYHVLVDRLLDQLKLNLSPAVVQALLDALAESLAEELRREVAHLPTPARRLRLMEVLNQSGQMVHWQESESGLQLIKYHCPYSLVGQHHPELCQIDQTLIRAVLETEVKQVACLRSGDPACSMLLEGES